LISITYLIICVVNFVLFIGLDLTNDYPTDRGHFKEFDTVKSDLKRSILLHGPCKPTNIEFPYSSDEKASLDVFQHSFITKLQIQDYVYPEYGYAIQSF